MGIMVLGSHVILTAYGFWLPNDPRGSWSDFVGSWELFRFGPATQVATRASVADRPHHRQARLAAKEALKYPPVRFSERQIGSIARGFAALIAGSGPTVWACSILPEHVHMVIARHTYKVEQIVNLLKGEATSRLVADGVHPMAAYVKNAGRPPKAWARGHWKVFLDTPADIRRAIEYVENNPAKEGRPAQIWPFVAEFRL
jgi:REP element-mobilizing transposase RayT